MIIPQPLRLKYLKLYLLVLWLFITIGAISKILFMGHPSRRGIGAVIACSAFLIAQTIDSIAEYLVKDPKWKFVVTIPGWLFFILAAAAVWCLL